MGALGQRRQIVAGARDQQPGLRPLGQHLRPGVEQDMQPLLIDDPPDGVDQRLVVGHEAPAERVALLFRGERVWVDVDAIGDDVDLVERRAEVVVDLAGHKARTGDHPPGFVGQSPLQAIDPLGMAIIADISLAAAALGGVDRGDQRAMPGVLERDTDRRVQPIVGVDQVEPADLVP